MIPSTPIYTPTPYLRSRAGARQGASLAAGCYNADMTLVEITYELQSPLTPDQLRRLGEFSNTYGLRRFHFDPSKNHLSFEYDASRLQDAQIAHVLGQATIAVARRVN
jgi:hypothetical protein